MSHLSSVNSGLLKCVGLCMKWFTIRSGSMHELMNVREKTVLALYGSYCLLQGPLSYGTQINVREKTGVQ